MWMVLSTCSGMGNWCPLNSSHLLNSLRLKPQPGRVRYCVPFASRLAVHRCVHPTGVRWDGPDLVRGGDDVDRAGRVV